MIYVNVENVAWRSGAPKPKKKKMIIFELKGEADLKKKNLTYRVGAPLGDVGPYGPPPVFLHPKKQSCACPKPPPFTSKN